jgi:hypothetical protein
MKALELPQPKGMPFQLVFSSETGRLSSRDGYGSSAVSFTMTPRV